MNQLFIKNSKNSEKRSKIFLLIQILTMARVPLAMIFAFVLLWFDRSVSLLAFCAVILVAAELTDLFDGFLARRLGVTSELGSMLDPYSDSVSRLIIYWALAVSGLVIPLVPMAMAFRDVTVAYSRIALSIHDRSVSAKWSGKIKAGFQSIGAYVVLMGPVYWVWTGSWTIQAASWIIIIVTLWSMWEYIGEAVVVYLQDGEKIFERPKGRIGEDE